MTAALRLLSTVCSSMYACVNVCVCKNGMMASLLLCEVRGSWLVKQYLTIQKEMDLTESRGATLGQTKHKQEGGTEYLLCEKRKETSL